ncbi:MAG: exodeoxyribonuclease VII small subunit [Chitinophagales bacterium]|nr:exodeoxyribonuclease VII small subunit [Chitinophagales bacterium]
MKSKLTYSEAFTKLEELVEQLEDGTIPLDKLAATVKQANEWVAVCEDKLRMIQAEVVADADKVSKKSKGKS